MTDDAYTHAVMGWLAHTLQHPIRGILNGAEQVSYLILDESARNQSRAARAGFAGPVVSVQWIGGPLAQRIAEQLAATSKPVFPPIEATEPTSRPTVADVIVGGIWVALSVEEPDPHAPQRMLGHPLQWWWPDPLLRTGAARSEVIWQGRPDQDTGSATVIHVPFHPGGGNRTYGVVDSSFRGLSEWSTASGPPLEAESKANIRLRTADAGWERKDAEHWARFMFPHYNPDDGPGADVAAVRLPSPTDSPLDSRIYLRVSWGMVAPGVEIMADLVERRWVDGGYEPGKILSGPMSEKVVAYAWASLASAVLSAATSSSGVLPRELWVHPLGISAVQVLFRLELNETTPTRG